MNNVKLEQKFFIQKKPDNTFLDTLEVTSHFYPTKQYCKAIRKFNTNSKIFKIVDAITSKKLQKTYFKTYHCNNVLLQENNTFKGSLCRKRWCTECNRIKSAELINGYKEPLLNLKNIYFVTLTIPNVKKHELRKANVLMIKAFQNIKNNIKTNYKTILSGVRKLEITYNDELNTYHPHFHIILKDKNSAILLRNLWLKHFKYADIKAQDIALIKTENDNSFIELFKYASKDVNSKGELYSGDVLNTIYQSINSLRIFQPFGKIKKVKDAEKKVDKCIIENVAPDNEIWIYENNKKDWLNSKSELLVNTLEIEKNILLKNELLLSELQDEKTN